MTLALALTLVAPGAASEADACVGPRPAPHPRVHEGLVLLSSAEHLGVELDELGFDYTRLALGVGLGGGCGGDPFAWRRLSLSVESRVVRRAFVSRAFGGVFGESRWSWQGMDLEVGWAPIEIPFENKSLGLVAFGRALGVVGSSSSLLGWEGGGALEWRVPAGHLAALTFTRGARAPSDALEEASIWSLAGLARGCEPERWAVCADVAVELAAPRGEWLATGYLGLLLGVGEGRSWLRALRVGYRQGWSTSASGGGLPSGVEASVVVAP